MNDAEIWAALERGGGVARGSSPLSGEAELRIDKYNGLIDPKGADALGRALSERIGDRQATLVVVWEDLEDIVLGYVVARELGVPLMRTFNADGLVGQQGPLPERPRAVFVTDFVRSPVVPRAVRALLERTGGELLGVASLLAGGEPADLPLLASLVSVPARRGEAGEAPSTDGTEPPGWSNVPES